MGLFDEPLFDIKENCLELWDYSEVFPLDPAYDFPKGPVFVSGWPWQMLRQLEEKENQQMTQPIISIIDLEPNESTRSFSDIYKTGVGAGQLQWRIGRRAEPSFMISCWVDQQLGGMDMARRLGGQVYAAILYYKNRLTKIRNLHLVQSHASLDDSSQL